jgi:hypothetical protein
MDIAELEKEMREMLQNFGGEATHTHIERTIRVLERHPNRAAKAEHEAHRKMVEVLKALALGPDHARSPNGRAVAVMLHHHSESSNRSYADHLCRLHRNVPVGHLRSFIRENGAVCQHLHDMHHECTHRHHACDNKEKLLSAITGTLSLLGKNTGIAELLQAFCAGDGRARSTRLRRNGASCHRGGCCDSDGSSDSSDDSDCCQDEGARPGCHTYGGRRAFQYKQSAPRHCCCHGRPC